MGTPTTSVIVLLFVVLFIQAIDQFSCGEWRTGYSNITCIESEQKALLKLRESLVDESNRLASWIGEDCCAWKGVICSNKTGHIIGLHLRNPHMDWWESNCTSCLRGKINPHILDLKHLHFLDLSGNNFERNIEIPQFFGSLENLRYLNLHNAGFGGKIPHHLGNLSRLKYLDLGYNYFLTVDSLWWISKVSSLKHLDLSWVNLMEATNWLQAINMFSSLSVVNLNGCGLGTIPHTLSRINFTSLASLDLSGNGIDSTIPLWLSNVSSLVSLRLYSNIFYGPVDILGRLTSLTLIDLSFNYFNTSVPNSLANLSSLVYLDLSDNQFQGNIPTTTIQNLCSLRVLDLSVNFLNGEIPSFGGKSFGCLQNLEYLRLHYNSFHGSIPASLGRLSGLRVLDVSDNHLNGSIPSSLGQLSNLEELYLRNNSLAGIVSENFFSKLVRLIALDMSSNNLEFNVSSEWIPPFQLKSILLESCKLGPRFPSWLQRQTSVIRLEISNTSISDTIPDWFEKLYCHAIFLDMSNNHISGKLPAFCESKDTYPRRYILMRSNKFEGPLTPFQSDVYAIDVSDNLLSGEIPLIQNATSMTLETLLLSNNHLSGEIPAYFCKIKLLRVLDLSTNQLSGMLPWCLGNLKELVALDLTGNKLQGEIPSSLGSLRKLRTLHLHNNKFCGKLPLSFMNLSRLSVLDLGKNAFTDLIPPWIGENLVYMKFLSLQENKFYGDIPPQLCWLSELQLLNLAQNTITGNIPYCFGNFTALMILNHNAEEIFFKNGSVAYQQNVLDSMKGIERRFTTTISYLTSIDLSNNNINGEIPEVIFDLVGLKNLNLAGNHLQGMIPEKIGELKELESLDLSRNKFSGLIPSSLSNLHYLSRFNLSFNNLSGSIPMGNQLQTLDDPSIYMGNSELCGEPLLKSCSGDKSSANHEHGEKTEGGDEFDLLWFYAGIGPGFLVGFLGVCSTLYFMKSWRYAWFGFVEKVYDRLFVVCVLTTTRLRRKFNKGEFGV